MIDTSTYGYVGFHISYSMFDVFNTKLEMFKNLVSISKYSF